MNSIKSIYNSMWSNSIIKFEKEQFELDNLICTNSDTRRGVTLLSRINGGVLSAISMFQQEVKSIAPEQYCYPEPDLHLTILSIISCVEGFVLENIYSNSYIEQINKSLVGSSPIKIHFKGITASNSCVMLQGFPEENVLHQLRNNLRENFKESGLQTTIDSRYNLSAAHSTIVRFQKPVNNPKLLLNLLLKYRNHDFGTLEVSDLEFVFNDWYLKKENTILISKHKIN